MIVGYITGRYPRFSHVFIEREIAKLRELGLDIRTFSVRRTPDGELAGDGQRRLRDETTALLPLRTTTALLTLLSILRNPMGLLRAASIAWQLRQPGLRGHLYALFYFAEGLILASHGHRQGITHWHDHFGDASANVALIAAQAMGVPFSLTLHGPDVFFEAERWKLTLKIHHARFVVCISDTCRARVRLFAQDDADREKLVVVRHGIPAPSTTPARQKTMGAFLMVCVARLDRAKGHDLLLKAMATIPGVRLRLIGDGPLRESLALRARALGIADRVEFLGALAEDEVRRELNGADLFVLPSLAEGLPVSLLEAMAAGVPVLASAIDAVPEAIIDEKNGLLCEPASLESLTEEIVKVVADPRFAQQLANQGRDFVARCHDPMQQARRLFELFTGAKQLAQKEKRVA